MEKEKTSESNCGCGCGENCNCPTPLPSSPWKKWIFIAIIFATATIVTFKIVGGNHSSHENCCEKHECVSSCQHQTSTDDDNTSCCPNSKTDKDE